MMNSILKTVHTGQKRYDFVLNIFGHLIHMHNSRRHFVVIVALR